MIGDKEVCVDCLAHVILGMCYHQCCRGVLHTQATAHATSYTADHASCYKLQAIGYSSCYRPVHLNPVSHTHCTIPQSRPIKLFVRLLMSMQDSYLNLSVLCVFFVATVCSRCNNVQCNRCIVMGYTTHHYGEDNTSCFRNQPWSFTPW